MSGRRMALPGASQALRGVFSVWRTVWPWGVQPRQAVQMAQAQPMRVVRSVRAQEPAL